MHTARYALFILFAWVPLVGCGSSAPSTETVRAPNPGANAGMTTAPPARADARTGNEGRCSTDPVYFPFDSADLDSSSRERLGQSARCLQQRNASSVMITGMTDPRGTEEYNLALGDRRARTVAGYVESLGLPSDKIRTTSVGEEMATGRDEGTWSRDRRAELSAQ